MNKDFKNFAKIATKLVENHRQIDEWLDSIVWVATMVWKSYLKVVAKNGGAGIERESIEMFNEKMVDKLMM